MRRHKESLQLSSPTKEQAMGWIDIVPKQICKLAQSWEVQIKKTLRYYLTRLAIVH